MKIRSSARKWSRREFFLAGVLGACGQIKPDRPPDPARDDICRNDTDPNNPRNEKILETRDGRCVRQAAEGPESQNGSSNSKKTNPRNGEASDQKTETDSSDNETDSGSSGDLADLKVTFDIGHGYTATGWDMGAVSRDLIEYELNRKAVLRATSLLRKQGAKVKVNDYSTASKGISLQEKGLAAGDCDLFVSVHHNSTDALSVQGSEVYYHSSGSFSDKRLAEELQSALLKNIWKNDQTKNRGAKSARFAILGSVPKSVGAACLTEGFFLSDKNLSFEKAQEYALRGGDAIAEALGLYWKQKSLSLSLFGDSKADWPLLPFPNMLTSAHLASH